MYSLKPFLGCDCEAGRRASFGFLESSRSEQLQEFGRGEKMAVMISSR
jgi:hypothetical protein